MQEIPVIPVQTELPLLFFRPFVFVRRYWFWLIILLIGATADAITTWHNLNLYGTAAEAHIVQRWVSEIFGVHAGVPLAKLGQVAFVLFVAAWWKPWTPWILTLCGVLYSAAAVSNYFALL